MWALGSVTHPSPHPGSVSLGRGPGGVVVRAPGDPPHVHRAPPPTPGGGEAPGDPPLFTEHPPPQEEVRAPGDPPLFTEHPPPQGEVRAPRDPPPNPRLR